MTASRLVVWRHGQTLWNAEHRFQGQVDVPLDEVGVAQADAAAAVLASYEPARLVSSDLKRAAQTADALAARSGLEVTYDQDLREVDVGSWGGLLGHEVRARFPELAARAAAYDPNVRRGGDGETLRELADRVEKALRRAIDSVGDGQTVIAACHGLATKVGVSQLIGLPTEHWDVLGGLDNCGWVTVEPRRFGPPGAPMLDPGPAMSSWRLTGWNLRAALP